MGIFADFCHHYQQNSSDIAVECSGYLTHLIMTDISVTLAGIPLTACVYNASGPRTGSSAAMSKIAKSASGGVLAKSATVASQKGNDLPRYVH